MWFCRYQVNTCTGDCNSAPKYTYSSWITTVMSYNYLLLLSMLSNIGAPSSRVSKVQLHVVSGATTKHIELHCLADQTSSKSLCRLYSFGCKIPTSTVLGEIRNPISFVHGIFFHLSRINKSIWESIMLVHFYKSRSKSQHYCSLLCPWVPPFRQFTDTFDLYSNLFGYFYDKISIGTEGPIKF